MPDGAKPLIVFAPGAGAPSTSPWMQAWTARLATLGQVSTFDYPYMRAGRKTPDRQPVLVAAHLQALKDARAMWGNTAPLVLAGKSMGSRMACHVAVERTTHQDIGDPGELPTAVICFGYPLRSATSGALRDAVLRALTTPVLFLQGSKDPLCPLPDLDAVRKTMKASSELFVVERGNHSLQVGVRDLNAMGKTQVEEDAEVLGAVVRFLRQAGILSAS